MAGLIDELRAALHDEQVASFQLAGEGLAALSPARLRHAADAWQVAFDRAVPAALSTAALAVHEEHAREAHDWLRRYNRSVHRRVRGYLELGRRCDYAYPWPVVAVLGIVQVSQGLAQSRWQSVVARPLRRAGLLPELDRIIDAGEDVLRRTNRGIFGDSVPVVLWGLRLHALRSGGEEALSRALLEGPPPVTMDEECVALARGLYDGLAIPDGPQRFAALAELTLRHFGREQQVFSFHLGRARPDRESWIVRRLVHASAVPAPRIDGGRLVFRPYVLPPGFDLRDHGARVAAFGEAFVRSVTRSEADYRVALRHVLRAHS